MSTEAYLGNAVCYYNIIIEYTGLNFGMQIPALPFYPFTTLYIEVWDNLKLRGNTRGDTRNCNITISHSEVDEWTGDEC